MAEPRWSTSTHPAAAPSSPPARFVIRVHCRSMTTCPRLRPTCCGDFCNNPVTERTSPCVLEGIPMPSPFPGMDPYLERNPVFHELHTQMLAEAQAQLQPQLRPKYVARLERHLSEGSVWDLGSEMISLAGKEPDLTVAATIPE